MLRDNRNGAERHESTKLVTTLLPRKNYIIHSCNLSLYLSLGMKLVKVHRVLKFNTSKFLGQYINYCTRKRREATTKYKKNIYKLMANSCYGKFIEDTRWVA